MATKDFLTKLAVEFFTKYGELSENKNKKYKVPVESKWVHFGDSRYPHFSNSKIPPKLRVFETHNDEERRDNYLKRAYGIKPIESAYDPDSPNFWSINILW